MAVTDHFTRVHFRRFKAFKTFTLQLRHFNILVGPNNAGKSTILAAFRILSEAMRRANTRSAQLVRGPTGQAPGHVIDLSAISIAEENIFFDYDDSEPASIKFSLSSGNQLLLFFPEQGVCHLIPDDPAKQIWSPSQFRSRFKCPVGFVPILGPVAHDEKLYAKEAARLALLSYGAARNFRNIWYHYPDEFESFRELLRQTWPGMDIEPPRVDYTHSKPVLHMFCPEERIPREIFWAGFGFQVWCQMLTHLIQARESSLFLIDEPDIYLHSDLQRQLLALLRDLGPDVLIATHSTEIITDAETDDIVIVNKRKQRAKRIENPAELEQVFSMLGSNLNPTLTQLARTRRAVFVEGKDFQILGRFAGKIGLSEIGNQSKFAVVPVRGFSPDRVRSLKRGMETTLGRAIKAAAVFDRDYRSDAECRLIEKDCAEFCDPVIVHDCNEVENFLLVPSAIDRAAARRIEDRAKRGAQTQTYAGDAESWLEEFAADNKSYVTAQYLAFRRQFERRTSSGQHEATTNQVGLEELEAGWKDLTRRLQLIPGKEALSAINGLLQEAYKVSVTPSAIISAMRSNEIPEEIKRLLHALSEFSSKR